MNNEIKLTLDEAVAEVLGLLTGLDLEYDPEQDRYRAITRQLNRALRANALERDWGFYADTLDIGRVREGERTLRLPTNARPRINGDDAVLLRDGDLTVRWAYFLPRDALHKYESKNGLWCAITRQTLMFSRDFLKSESELDVHIPVMREPRMFRLPDTGEEVRDAIRDQLVDFDYPDVIIARAAWNYAQTDPIMQPRVQTLEAGYKDLMYQLIERDTNITDTPYLNEFRLPIHGSLEDVPLAEGHLHPHSDY
jgi:hypothetical protein